MWKWGFIGVGVITVIVSKTLFYELLGCGVIIIAGLFQEKRQGFRRIK